MRPTAIVQARMASERLPGKSLRLVQGRPMLAYVIERLRRCGELAATMVATSIAAEDDAIASFCEKLGVACHRGPREDVLTRFLGAVEALSLPVFVRINGDSPLIDPAIVDRAVRLFAEGGCDLATNVARRSFPKGQSVEVISADALRLQAAQGPTAEEREHVTLWFYRHPERVRIRNFAADTDMSGVQLSVDTADDFAAFAAIVEAMERPHWDYGLAELLELRRKIALAAAPS
jgi:spore coat polysaccharide biosynthesis protein SpsF